MKPKLRLLVTGVLLLLVGWVNAQTTHLSPTINNGGFESGSTGWTFVNAAHSWTVGTNAGAFFGTNSAYISPNSSAYSYSNTTTATSHMYRDIAIPALQTDISLSFQHKGVGEPGWDRLLVYAAPNTFTPTAGTPNSNSTVNGAATLIYTAPMNSSSYALVTVSIPGSFAGTTMRLIFTWQNDNSVGSNPPSSIDDVTLVSNIGPGIYYSKAGATNFADPASWGSNTDGTGASPASVSSADNFNISNGSVMVLNSNASVRTLTILSGSLSVAANTLTVAIPGVNNSNLTMSGGTLTVSGLGTVNVNGQFQVLGTAAFNQSGGNINVDGNAGGVAANSVPSGQSIVNFTSSVLNLTGGTFTIVDPHASTIASESFRYNTGTSYNSGAGHTFRFGNGVSTDAGGDATNGFRTNTWQSSGRFLFGNITVDLVTTASNRFVTHIWSHGINGNLTINTGDYRANVGTYVAGNVVNNGTLTTTNTLLLSTFFNGTAAPVSTPQTISGTGVFRNSTTASTANFLNLTVNNTSSSGVTFTGANSVISGTNTGTVSGTLTFTNGRITSANTFVLGVSTTTLGTLTTVSGGFTAGTTFRRWFSTTSMVTLLSATTPVFPFVTTTGQDRSVFLARNGTTFTTGGWIEATHAPTAGLVTVAITDGPYNVNRRTAASWSFASGGSINIGASVLSVGARADGAFTLLAAPGAAPRFVQAAGALGTHTAGTGSAISPIANRGGLTLANLTGAQHFVGVATADLPIFSIASGNWNTGATWSTNSVPTPSDIVLVTTGTTVTVNSAAAANILTVQGSLDVTAGTLTVTGTAAGNGVTISGGGSLNASGGTVNVGIVGNVTNNRTLLVANAGTLNVSAAGLVNVYGNLNFATGSAFVQTGGNIVVDGNAGGVAANSVPVGVSIVNFSTANVAGATGGTLTIVDPHANATSTLAFGFNMPAGFNCALGVGHTLRFGNGVSTDAGGSNTRQFGVDHWVTSSRMVFGNVQISTGAGINRVVTNPFTTQTVGGNLTIDAGSEWSASFIRLGGNVTNNGTLTVTGELAFCTSELVAFAQAPAPNAQTIGGSGVYRNAVAATANAPQMLIGNSSAGGVTFNIPFTQQGNFLAAQGRINTTTTNVLTHIKTTVGQSVGTSANFPNQAAYVTGPFRVQYNIPFTNAQANHPVGTVAGGPSWLGFFNVTNTAPVTIEVNKNGTIAAPTSTDGSVISLVPGHEWVTSIVSGAASLTSFNVGLWSVDAAFGRVIASYTTAAGNWSAFGSGSNFTSSGPPLFNILSQNLPPISGSAFPERIAIGNTGPLNITEVTMAQNT
ncbi:MAG: beta strand repeat-containing protein, partial [Bacteroidia bacterium]